MAGGGARAAREGAGLTRGDPKMAAGWRWARALAAGAVPVALGLLLWAAVAAGEERRREAVQALPEVTSELLAQRREHNALIMAARPDRAWPVLSLPRPTSGAARPTSGSGAAYFRIRRGLVAARQMSGAGAGGAAQPPSRLFGGCEPCRLLGGGALLLAAAWIYRGPRQRFRQGVAPGMAGIAQITFALSVGAWGIVILVDPVGKQLRKEP